MDEQLAAVREAFGEAGIEVPADPAGMALDALDTLVEDRRLRGKCKSALVKYQRAAKEAGAMPAPAPEPTPEPVAEAAPEPEPEPAAEAALEPEPVAEAAPEPEPEQPEQPEAEPAPAAPMSDALRERHEALVQAFADAGAEPPAELVGFSLDLLDEQIEDKKVRGKVKSAAMKFRRLAEEEGWQPAGAPVKAVKTAPTAEAAPAAETEAPPTEESPADPLLRVPATAPNDLWLLTPTGWEKLGTATRQPALVDEIVGQQTETGQVARITSVLTLDGTFTVPPDLYNTLCWLAHEGVVYKAYYISHVGDVKRGTKTASLKVDETLSPAEFAARFEADGRADRPTADLVRRRRFGRQYDAERAMFAQPAGRLV